MVPPPCPPRRAYASASSISTPATRELRRDGTPVRLQAQPAQVLALLLAHAGEVVTREALQQAIWGTETFVDFDRGLNFCIAQIRTALGDSADSPLYVKTLPKRGYQFIAPVATPELPRETAPPPRSRRRVPWQLATPVLLAATAAAAFLLMHQPAPPALTIAVTRFDNETGNAEFDRFADGLTDSVVAQLTTSGAGRYGVIGNAAILRYPRSRRNLLEIASTLKANYVVLGQVQRSDPQVRVLVHLIRLPDQKHLWVTRFDLAAGAPLPNQTAMAQRVFSEFNKRLTALPPPASN